MSLERIPQIIKELNDLESRLIIQKETADWLVEKAESIRTSDLEKLGWYEKENKIKECEELVGRLNQQIREVDADSQKREKLIKELENIFEKHFND